MKWKLLDTGKRSARENMEIDSALLADLEIRQEPLLHFYDWEQDALTFGHFIQPQKILREEGMQKLNLVAAKRPTGGGVIFHNCDLAFSVLVPASHPAFSLNPLENYWYVNQKVKRAVLKYSSSSFSAELLEKESPSSDTHSRFFCMAKPTKYDVMLQDKKVGGAAQRKTRFGYLHQGSIALGLLPQTYLEQVLIPGTAVFESMRQCSFLLLGEVWSLQELNEARNALRNCLQEVFLNE